MRGLLEFFTIFNYISPAIGFIEDVANDPDPLRRNSWTFFIPFDELLSTGKSAANVEKLMAQHGIRTWGDQLTGGEFFFCVSRDQAAEAEGLLESYGVPLRLRGAPPPNPEPQFEPMSSTFRFGDMILVPQRRSESAVGRVLRRLIFGK